jgi:hypothetical protein
MSHEYALGILSVDDNPIDIRLAQAFLAISGIEYDVCVRHGAGAPTRRFTNVLWAFVNELRRRSHYPMPAGRMTERVP